MSAEIDSEVEVELDSEFNKISLKDDEIKSFPATCIIPSTQLHVFKRLLHEIEDVNKDFHSLRTVIIVDPEEHINLFYFCFLCHKNKLNCLKLIDPFLYNAKIFCCLWEIFYYLLFFIQFIHFNNQTAS